MKYKIELHVHTRYSIDSLLNCWFILFMCKIKKIKYLGITDHNELKGALKYQKKLGKFGIVVIPGEEIMTSCGEIIGLYLTEKIEPNLTPLETINEIKRQNGIVYLPHPYDEKRYKTVLDKKQQERLKDNFDFIEIYNGRNISDNFGEKQQEIQMKLGIKPIIGSDSHTFFELGRNYMLVDSEINRENFKESIENSEFVTKKCLNIAHKCTKIARIITIIEKGDFHELRRIISRKCKRKK